MELNIKRAFAFFAFIAIFALAISVVSAVDNDTPPSNDKNKSAGNGLKVRAMLNGTYGDCVSDLAKQDKVCYASAKQNRVGCEETLKQSEAIQNKSAGLWTKIFGHKECRNAYKSEKSSCKQGFKTSKAECKALKNKQ